MILHHDWIHTYAHKLDPRLRRLLREREQGAPPAAAALRRIAERHGRKPAFPAIICLHPDARDQDCSELLELAAAHGGIIHREFGLIGGFGATLSLNAAKELVGHDAVCRIAYDCEVHTLLDVASPAIGAPLAWEEGRSGRGITIAVVDTGVYPHSDFTEPRNRLLAFADLVDGRRRPYDDNGHGTHVAGCALGNGAASEGKYRGPAFEAGLVAVKALDRTGAGRASDIIEAISWVVENRDRYGIRVLSLSIGAEAETSYRDDPLAQAAARAWDAGIVVCAAAGNAGPDPRTISTPGIEPKVITVGAIDDRGTVERSDDVLAPYSSRGPTPDGLNKPELLAPGSAITAPRARGSVLDAELPAGRPNYLTLSGTSMATPLVAGLAALILEAEPSLSPADVKRRLMRTAERWRDGGSGQGAGYVRFSATRRRRSDSREGS
ncbi:MAG TPA: S8 family peptidase [Limnochordia bacterium]